MNVATNANGNDAVHFLVIVAVIAGLVWVVAQSKGGVAIAGRLGMLVFWLMMAAAVVSFFSVSPLAGAIIASIALAGRWVLTGAMSEPG